MAGNRVFVGRDRGNYRQGGVMELQLRRMPRSNVPTTLAWSDGAAIAKCDGAEGEGKDAHFRLLDDGSDDVVLLEFVRDIDSPVPHAGRSVCGLGVCGSRVFAVCSGALWWFAIDAPACAGTLCHCETDTNELYDDAFGIDVDGTYALIGSDATPAAPPVQAVARALIDTDERTPLLITSSQRRTLLQLAGDTRGQSGTPRHAVVIRFATSSL